MTMLRPLAVLLLAVVLILPMSARAEVTVEKVVSPGGLTAWLVRDDTVPVTAIEFTFKGGGSAHDPQGREGTAVLTSTTMDEGAGPYDSKAFQGILADKSLRISFSAGKDGFSGSFYSLNRYRDEALDLLHLALTEPRFDEEPVNRIRGQILVGMKQEETDPGSVAGKALRETVFDGHPYALSGEGDPESLSLVTAEDMRRFMGDALTRDKLLIGVVGAITPEELGPMLDRVFGDLPATGVASPIPDFPGAPPPGVLVADMDIPQSTILFAQRGLRLDDPRYYAGMVLNHILGGGSFSSILTEEIRVKRGLAYSVYSFLHPMDHAALLRGGAGTQNARVGETVALIRDVFRDLKENGVPAGQVADAKTYLTGSFPLRFTNSSSIAGQLVSMQYHGFPIDYFATRNARVEAVTVDQVNKLAAELLDPDGLFFAIVGRPEGVEATLD